MRFWCFIQSTAPPPGPFGSSTTHYEGDTFALQGSLCRSRRTSATLLERRMVGHRPTVLRSCESVRHDSASGALVRAYVVWTQPVTALLHSFCSCHTEPFDRVTAPPKVHAHLSPISDPDESIHP